jgi:hypothetical protein
MLASLPDALLNKYPLAPELLCAGESSSARDEIASAAGGPGTDFIIHQDETTRTVSFKMVMGEDGAGRRESDAILLAGELLF